MLLDRSKRSAGADAEVPRLRLITPWQLGLVGVLVCTLLVMVFPRQALVEKLYAQDTLDELTLSYTQNLYRADPSNADVALLLARTQQSKLSLPDMEGLLWRLVEHGDARQRPEALVLLWQAYQRGLDGPIAAAEKNRIHGRLLEMMQAALSDALPVEMDQAFAALAFELNRPQLGLAYFKKFNTDRPALILEKYGDISLGQGHYLAAAEYFFQARQAVPEGDEARRLFEKGVRTLMAGGLFKQAMASAAKYLGPLQDDLPTLRFLAAQAQAAGDPEGAARYAAALVFRNSLVAP